MDPVTLMNSGSNIYEKLIRRLKVITSKAWLVSRFDEDKEGHVKPKITLRYFGYLVLDMKKRTILFQGSVLKFKKILIKIPLNKVKLVRIHGGTNLRIKWVGDRGTYHNALFLVGELDALGIAHPSKRAAEVWYNLLNKALEIAKSSPRK